MLLRYAVHINTNIWKIRSEILWAQLLQPHLQHVAQQKKPQKILTTEVSVSNGVPTEIVTLPVEKTAEQIAEEKEKERIAELTNNGQYTVEQAEQILSGTTRELE